MRKKIIAIIGMLIAGGLGIAVVSAMQDSISNNGDEKYAMVK
jgi:hypothetical protein